VSENPTLKILLSFMLIRVETHAHEANQMQGVANPDAAVTAGAMMRPAGTWSR
jgi:hypothetical protein